MPLTHRDSKPVVSETEAFLPTTFFFLFFPLTYVAWALVLVMLTDRILNNWTLFFSQYGHFYFLFFCLWSGPWKKAVWLLDYMDVGNQKFMWFIQHGRFSSLKKRLLFRHSEVLIHYKFYMAFCKSLSSSYLSWVSLSQLNSLTLCQNYLSLIPFKNTYLSPKNNILTIILA